MFKYFMILSIFVFINCEDTSSPKGDIVPTSYKCGGTGMMETHYSYTCTKPNTKTNSLTDSSTINKEVADYQKNGYACTISSKDLGDTTYHEYTCVKTDTKTNTSTDSSLIDSEVSKFETDSYTCSKSDEEKEEQCDSADNACECETICYEYEKHEYVCAKYKSESKDEVKKCYISKCLLFSNQNEQQDCISGCYDEYLDDLFNVGSSGGGQTSFDDLDSGIWFVNDSGHSVWLKPESGTVSIELKANGRHSSRFNGFADSHLRPGEVYKTANDIRIIYNGTIQWQVHPSADNPTGSKTSQGNLCPSIDNLPYIDACGGWKDSDFIDRHKDWEELYNKSLGKVIHEN